jgi:hypothetical protein
MGTWEEQLAEFVSKSTLVDEANNTIGTLLRVV